MATTDASAAETEGSTPTTRRVLVAEDDSLIRMDLIEMLREEGYDVVGEAPTVRWPSTSPRSSKPDLVIMDVKMPVPRRHRRRRGDRQQAVSRRS